jgi:transposase-like protein
MVKKTNYESGFKFKAALEALKGDKTDEEIATGFNISKSGISKWREEWLRNGANNY